MTSTLTDQLGVAEGARHWDVPGFRLHESTRPGVLLYVATHPRLARDATGRPVGGITQRLRWSGGRYVSSGGSAVLTVGGDPLQDPLTRPLVEEQWARAVRNSGWTEPGAPRFVPLPVRDVRLTAAVDPAQGAVVAPPGGSGSSTLLLDLTADGAEAWVRQVRDGGDLPGSVRLTYAHPQLLAPATAVVRTHGARVYRRLAALLDCSADGTVSGSPTAVRAAWDALVREGAVEVLLSGEAAGDLGATRASLVEQARQQLFESLFLPATPDGSSLVLRWRRADDVPDLPLTIRVEGWTWLPGGVEAELRTLLADLDGSAVHVTYEQVSVPLTVTVEPCPLVRAVALSVDAGEAHPPEALTFDGRGGSRRISLTTTRPEDLSVRFRAQIDYEPPGWAPLDVDGAATPDETGVRVTVTPESHLRRHTIYAYVRDGDRLVRAPREDSADQLTVTVSHAGAGGAPAARSAARVTADVPVELCHPVGGPDAPGAVLSAIGTVGGRLVSATDLPVDPEEKVLYLLVDGDRLQLVGRNAVLPEDDRLAERLRDAGGRPAVTREAPPVPESGGDLDVVLDVPLIPQPTDVTCWAAALAMVVSARDSASYAPQTIGAAAGMDMDTGYGWSSIRHAVAAWDLVEEGPRSAVPEEWARLLEWWGPIWVVEVGAPYHAVVVSGVYGDGTPEGTYVRLHNPWPPQIGVVEWKTFLDFDWEFGLGAGAGAAMVHAR